MQGRNWDQVIAESEKGIKLCQDFKCAELMPEADKQGKEFANIKLKAMARQKNMSALDLREELNANEEQGPQEEPAEAIAVSKSTVMLQTAAAYVVTSAAVLGYLAYQRSKVNQ
jgi:hypothetical protein